MKKSLIAISVLGLALASCGTKSNTVKLTATFPADAKDSVNIFYSLDKGEKQIDTNIAITNGTVVYELPKDEMNTVMVIYGRTKLSAVRDAAVIKMDFTGEKPVLDAGSNSINAEFTKVNEKSDSIIREARQNMMAIYQDSTIDDAAKQTRVSDYVSGVYKTLETYYKDLLAKNPKNYLGAYGVYSLEMVLEDAQLDSLFKTIDPALKDNADVARLVKELDKKTQTAEGKMFTDFSIEETPGNVKKLSDYVGKGKYVLVDFWASWCGPCRREIPNLKKVYEKFHGDQFEILSVAVWDKPEDTKKALEEEGLKWPQIINAQKVPTDMYGISGIPHIILFGPDGTILKRGLRGDAITEELSKYIKK